MAGTASDGGVHVTDDLRLVTAAIDVVNKVVAAVGVVFNPKVGVEYTAVLVTAAKHFVDQARIDVGVGSAVSGGSAARFAVTAAKHLFDATAIHIYVAVCILAGGINTDVGCIAAAMEGTDGVFTTIDVHRGASGYVFRGRLIRSEAGHVATAKHLVDGILLR